MSEQKRIRKFTMRQVSVVFSKCGVQSNRKCESHESCVCIVGFSACVCQKKERGVRDGVQTCSNPER